jgi:pimeloyl-ACP methyl ester carboxylesterase
MASRLSWRAALAGLTALPTLAHAGTDGWTALALSGGGLLRKGPEQSDKAFVFFPGANCAAKRYGWLAGLATASVTVYLFDPAPPSPGAATFPKIADVVAALDVVRPRHKLLLGGGHSAGAAAMLDSLDPISAQASPRDHMPADYRPPQDVAGVAVMGCTLQPRTLNMVMTYRSEDRPLTRPHDAPLLFLAGDHDLVAPPALIEKTRARFAPPTQLTILAGATHYGWLMGHGDKDHDEFNAPGGVSKETQQAMSLARLAPWIAERTA